jgi:hypothetical protein
MKIVLPVSIMMRTPVDLSQSFAANRRVARATSDGRFQNESVCRMTTPDSLFCQAICFVHYCI